MDIGGKDGVIHRVFQDVNPQGVRVAHFGVPTPEEKDMTFSGEYTSRSRETKNQSFSTVATMKAYSSKESTIVRAAYFAQRHILPSVKCACFGKASCSNILS